MTMPLKDTNKRVRGACGVSPLSVPNAFENYSLLMLPKWLDTVFKLIMRHDQRHTGLLEWKTFFSLNILVFCLYTMVFDFVFFYGSRSLFMCVFPVPFCHCYYYYCCLFSKEKAWGLMDEEHQEGDVGGEL